MKPVSLRALLVALAIPTFGPAQAAVPDDGLLRTIDLTEIGYPSGLEFEKLSGEAVAFFPVGAREAIEGMTLRLDLVHGQTVSVATHLKVLVNDAIAHSEALPADRGRSTIVLDLPPEAARDGFVKIGLSYAGASSDSVCFDERSSGDFLRILPSSSLALALDRAALDTIDRVAQVMPPAKILAAAEDVPADRALPFALRAAALFDAEYGLVSIGASGQDDADGWDSMSFSLGATGTGAGDEAGSVALSGAAEPGLVFGSDDPELGLAFAASQWRGLGGAEGGATRIAAPLNGTRDAVTFSALGAPQMQQMVIGSSTFEFGFAADDFATGRLPTGVELLVGAARSPEGHGVTVSAYLNGALLGSRPLDADEPVWMQFAIPRGLVGRDNQMRILVQRQAEGGNCLFKPQGYPAQILPQSRFVLGDAPEAAGDFFLMRQAFSRGVELVAGPEAEIGTYLPWLLPVAGTLLPETADVTMPGADLAAEEADATRPFLYVGRTAPEGATPGLRFDQGRVEIRDAAGEMLYSGATMDEATVVQIVEVGDRPGIWLRPGTGPAPRPTRETPLLLDRGDLAVIDEDGLALVASTRRGDLVDIAYPDRLDVMQVFARYRPWIIGAAWLALTLVVVRSLQGMYRRSRAGKDG
ncbi:cellulose biosynthesis cyclic di-GMP-binding regulatory protein BcsB [Limimaricola pyoseonensis]|uniref:Cyclic di-GMP-binding protein n=1 Tax=Limimaricola pyoseonensis TaxID=521013 RepID=A0A1G7JIT8_9RHOB|nr:cellulose biosynthesis cyclic di-GMP-binding regulatory protein BcsB [Limimaricola pyoseonensis]SDF24840.1 cellulose synthase subunit [Limimaricola pyoseonensis]